MTALIATMRYFLVTLLSISALSLMIAPSTVLANSCSDARILTFPAWYNGIAVEKNGGCEMISPTEYGEGKLGPYIWKIVLNLVEIILNLVGYAAVAYIIYGGYKYMTSAGSPDGMVGARKTILNAVIGLVISVAAVAIVRTIATGIGGVG